MFISKNRPSVLLSFLFTVFSLSVFPVLAHAEGGMEFGGVAGGVHEPLPSTPLPQTVELGFYTLGGNPKDGNTRAYGAGHYDFELTPIGTDGKPTVGMHIAGMNGWQLFGAQGKSPTALHLGVEPLNIHLQMNQDLIQQVSDLSKRGKVEHDATKRDQFAYWEPMVSGGVEFSGSTCRLIALVRGGGAVGAYLKPAKTETEIAPAAGAGLYANCPSFDATGEWTHIFGNKEAGNQEALNAEVMVKPIPHLGVGVTGQMVVNRDAKGTNADAPSAGDSLQPTGQQVSGRADVTVRWSF